MNIFFPKEPEFETRVSLTLETAKKFLDKGLNISIEKSIPAFVVFSDASLIEMAKVRPKNLQEMLKINGVGPSKLKKYGSLFLTEINK